MSFADNFCKQFGTRPGPTERQAWSGSKLFDTLIVFLKESLVKNNLEKQKKTIEDYKGIEKTKTHRAYPQIDLALLRICHMLPLICKSIYLIT